MNFSVVVPLYNKEYAVERCLNSILAQTKQPLEIIVVNDGSSDGSFDIVKSKYQKEIEQNIIRVFDQANKGVSAARNLGIQQSSSEYICLLDADDEWLPDFLKTMSLLVERCPEANLYCLAHRVSKRGNRLYKPKHGLPESHQGYIDDFFKASTKGNVVNSSKVCIRKQAIVEFGGFPEGIVAGEDIFVWIMLALNGKVACDMKYLAVIHSEEDSSRSARKLSIPYPFVFFSKNKAMLDSNSLNRYLFTIFYQHFLHSLLSLKSKEAALRLKWYIRMYI
jgi:glycosyltransferase involved in cell wall biosynthesis